MTTRAELAADLGTLSAATDRLLATVSGWDAELAEPSILPGWSRAHVLAHLARNADALRNLLLGVRAGSPVPMYPSRQVRDADIEAGAGRPPAVVLEDLQASAERFALDLAHLDEGSWDVPVPMRDGSTIPAAALAAHRLREVEMHHVDLGAGYGFADSPRDVLVGLLDFAAPRFGGSSLDPAVLVATDLGGEWRIGTGGGPRIAGEAARLFGWLAGRTGAEGLTSDSGAVPTSPGWG